jgi:hypothetical protein
MPIAPGTGALLEVQVLPQGDQSERELKCRCLKAFKGGSCVPIF